jgi:hypothetical protein
MEPAFRSDGEAAFLRDGNEVTQMSKLHGDTQAHAFQAWSYTYKVFFIGASKAYIIAQRKRKNPHGKSKERSSKGKFTPYR